MRESLNALGEIVDKQRQHSSLGYVPSLDGLRGIAILLVLVHHAYGGWEAGAVGVDVFFVLSGYLITAILLKEMNRSGQIGLVNFYVRRLFRLYPALLVVIVATAAMAILAGRSLADFALSLLAAGTYTTNLGTVFAHLDLGPLKHTWSLAQEEQFYLLWPLVLIVATKFHLPRKVLLAGVVLVAFGCLGLFFIATGHGSATLNPVARMGGLAAGCALAIALSARVIALPRWAGWAGALGGCLALVLASVGAMSNGLLAPVIVVASTLVLASLVTIRDGALSIGLSYRPLAYVGVISYSLYLWHFPLFYFAQGVNLGTWGTAALVLPASFVLAALSRKYIELPALALRDRLGVSHVSERPSLPLAS
jgi:peptidoglycan/LPS O-acetylase OafA/YrhL